MHIFGHTYTVFSPPRSRPGAKGFSLIEAVVAAAIIAVGIAGIMTAYTAYDRSAGEAVPSIQAMFLAEEGLEAVNLQRDESWHDTLESVTTGTPYFLAWDGTDSKWTLAATPSEVDGRFYRTVTFASVERNADDDITPTGGTIDPYTLLATCSVAWIKNGATTTVSLSEYVSDLFDSH